MAQSYGWHLGLSALSFIRLQSSNARPAMVAVVDDASASSGGLLRDVLARSWRRLHDVGKLEQALIVLVIVTAIYIVVARVSSRGNSKSQKQIILVGPSSSGKTALFTKVNMIDEASDA